MGTINRHDARSLPDDERLAREVVAPHIDSILVALPEPGNEPTPDFEMCRDGKRVGWLEVTTGTDQASQTLNAQLEEAGRRRRTTRRLRCDWFLQLTPDSNLRTLNEERLFDALALREPTLTPYPTAMMDPISIPESDAILAKFHVARANPLNASDGDEATVLLDISGQMNRVDADTINRLAEQRCDAKRPQLEGRQGERHLFVRVDKWERSGAGVAMHGFGDNEPPVPYEGPTFPEWVSDVWLLNTVGQPKLWHCSQATEAWKIYDIDPAVFKSG